jgi:MerR family transcriptional regulator, copper efflux regulator
MLPPATDVAARRLASRYKSELSNVSRARTSDGTPCNDQRVLTHTQGELMTVGELARRTGLTVKAIRRYEALGLIYSAGRSEGNYRLFDESALWCASVIATLRSLGLTIKEIERLVRIYLDNPEEPVGPHLTALLDAAEQRIEAQVAELEEVRARIRDYRSEHAAALAGKPGARLMPPDPRRVT